MHDNLSTTISPIRLLVVEYDVWSKTRYDFHITTKEKGRNINAVRTCDPQTFELNSQGPFSHGVTHMYFPQTANFYLICTKNVMSAKSVRFVPPKIEFTALTLCILMEFSIHINIHAIDCVLQGATGRNFLPASL